MKTISQERAASAFAQVAAAHQALRGDFEQDYADKAKKVPMRIRTAGLAQTLAYLQAKKESAEVCASLAAWCHARKLSSGPRPEDLLKQAISSDASTLRLLTSECLAYLEWLVRFADARKKAPAAEKAS